MKLKMACFGSRNLLLIFCLCIHTLGQDGMAQTVKGTLSLAKAMETADANYGAVKAKDLYAKSSEESRKQVRREYIPALKLHGQANYGTANSVPGTYFPYGIVVPISGGIGASNNFNPVYGSIGMGYFEWAPFTFGQYKARVKEADLRLDLAQADADQERFYNKIFLSQAYLDALVAIRLQYVLQKNLERNILVHNVIVEIAKNGLRPGVDTSFANSEIAKAQLSLLEASKNVAEQQRNLADLMGVSNTGFDLDTMVFFQMLPQLPAAPANDINANPILRMYQARQGLSEMHEKEIFRNYFPKISILGVMNGRGSGIMYNGRYDESLNGMNMSRFNYAGGIAATFNILDYPRMRAELNAEKYITDAARTELDEKTLDLKNDLVLADEKLRIALDEMKQAPIQYAAASDFYNQKLAMYKSGLANIVDLSQALYNLTRAEADLAVARDAVWKAVLNKSSVNGDLNLFLNATKTK